MSNATIAIDALLALLIRGTQIAQLIQAAQAQGRDLTPAELDLLVKDNDAARDRLVAAIAAARNRP